MESEDTSIVDIDYHRIIAKDKKGTTNIKYNIRSAESGNVIYSGSIPSTVYSISIDEENYYGIYLLPGESRQVTANIEVIMDQFYISGHQQNVRLTIS